MKYLVMLECEQSEATHRMSYTAIDNPYRKLIATCDSWDDAATIKRLLNQTCNTNYRYQYNEETSYTPIVKTWNILCDSAVIATNLASEDHALGLLNSLLALIQCGDAIQPNHFYLREVRQ
ncbi:MAG TPA: hypothetical protein VKR58_05700 [Aquella sp.]|nr:hypothetical protein [Aquella sp.]